MFACLGDIVCACQRLEVSSDHFLVCESTFVCVEPWQGRRGVSFESSNSKNGNIIVQGGVGFPMGVISM